MRQNATLLAAPKTKTKTSYLKPHTSNLAAGAPPCCKSSRGGSPAPCQRRSGFPPPRAPVEAITVHEVKGYGLQKSYVDQYDRGDLDNVCVPKVEITLWVDPLRAEEIIEKLTDVSRTGNIGDGKIMMLSTI